MKLFSRVSALALAALFACMMFVGCNDNGKDPVATGDDDAEEMTYLDALPAKYDMDGTTIRFWSNSNSSGSLFVEELEADLVNNAVYERNNIVQRRFNVKMDVRVIGAEEITEMIRNAVLSDIDDFDACAVYQYTDVRLAQEGVLLNLANQDNFDFSQPYWGTEMMEGMSYKGAMYWATGDMFQNYVGGMYVTFLNKQLWENYYPGVDYYEIVENGEWTYDKLDELCSKVYEDVNRNTERDTEDVYGMYFMNWTELPDALIYSTGMTFTSRDELGTPVLSIDMEQFNTTHRVIKKLLFDNDGVLSNQDELWHEQQMARFAQDKTLFYMNNLFYAETNHFRNMESDYAILPMPKLNEEQENYITILHDGTSLLGIPITNAKLNETTMLIEALASESYRTVTPVYYDQALKFKYQRDDAAGAMIDMIRDGVTGDFAYYYHVGATGNSSDDWMSITYVLRSIYEKEHTPLVSTVKSYQNKWTTDLDTLLTALETNSKY